MSFMTWRLEDSQAARAFNCAAHPTATTRYQSLQEELWQAKQVRFGLAH
jgi:hypothetical protein